jgi:TRAP transporter TAXI family solute receptor
MGSHWHTGLLSRWRAGFGGRALALVAVPSALIVAGVFYSAYRIVDPLPPARFAISAGTPGSSYWGYAQRYRAILARDGVDLEVRTSEGAAENLAALRDKSSGVAAALATSGVAPAADAKDLAALGAVYQTPLWIFYRSPDTLTRFSELAGKRVAIGTPGGTVKQFATDVLAASGALKPSTTLVELTLARALDALNAGEVDAILMPGTLDTEVVQRALAAPGLRLMNLEQADAISKIVPTFSHVVVPRGLLDLGKDRPGEDIHLLATANSVIVRNDLHPALQYLLLKAMKEVHSPPGPFQRFAEFPAQHPQDLPLSPTAARFYRSGPPLVHEYATFWVAVLLDRAIFVLGPVVAVLIPIMGFAPALYRWLNRRRIWRWYRSLAELESEIAADPRGERAHDHDARLREIDANLRRLNVPPSFANELYGLKQHVQLIHDQLHAAATATRAQP